jgi:hypothetical protein
VTLDKTSLLVGSAEANWIINVTAAASCTWTVSTDSSWLVVKSTFPTVQPVSGTGYAKVRAVANTTGARRVGRFTINGTSIPSRRAVRKEKIRRGRRSEGNRSDLLNF